jgi:hypothetical protein
METRWSHGAARSLVLAAVLALTAAGLAACGGADGAAGLAPSATASPVLSPSGGTPAPGAKMAPGLYDLEGGSVVAVGTVEHRELEGGFWAVVGGAEADGDQGKVVAVIANGDDYAARFSAGEGLSFLVYGRRSGDASIRMAGPEIIATRVELASEGGSAE